MAASAIGTARTGAGGYNEKPLADHLRDGTYRPDRHGKIDPSALDYPAKPPGRITAGLKSQRKWIRNATDEVAVRNGCRFNEALAVHAVEFFPRFLCHSQGVSWAGKPFTMTDFQRESMGYPIFGWVRPDGFRRFRHSYIEMPKKVGKSTWAAGLGVYMLCADGEPGSTVLSYGADKDQAKIVHNEAINMVDASEALASVLKINRSTGNISYPFNNSFYRAMAGKPRGHAGGNIHCGIVDELHEWFGNKVWNQIRYGYRFRDQPFQLVITNAGDDLESVCYRVREKAQAILAGKMFDDSFFAMISSVTREEAESEIEAVKNGATELPVARKCTPDLGIILKEERLLADIQDAIQIPSELPNLKRFTYGIWAAEGSNPLLSYEHWQKCAEDFTLEDLYGRECYAGLDLSQTHDLTALALMFPFDDVGQVKLVVQHWLPSEEIESSRHLVDYATWARLGHLTPIPGPIIVNAVIEEAIVKASELFDLRQVWYDAMFAQDLAQRLEDEHSIEVVKFPQTIMEFAGPTARFEGVVLSRELRHNDNPLLNWQAENVQCKKDRTGNNNKRPVKQGNANDHRKIDGIVASIMALRGVMMRTTNVNPFNDPDREVLCV